MKLNIFTIVYYFSNEFYQFFIRTLDIWSRLDYKHFCYACLFLVVYFDCAWGTSCACVYLQDWLTESARLIAKSGSTVEWVTPLGLPIVQPYHRTRNHVVSVVTCFPTTVLSIIDRSFWFQMNLLELSKLKVKRVWPGSEFTFPQTVINSEKSVSFSVDSSLLLNNITLY